MDHLNQALFGLYPYVAIVVFALGSLVRFDREQYTWKSDSSELLRRGRLRIASNLFHLGILGIFFGHLGGLLTPAAVWHVIGVTPAQKQLTAMVAGGIAGILCFVGLAMLIQRRLFDSRIRVTSRTMDIVILLLFLAQLLLGLGSIFVSANHLDGGEMLKLMDYVQGIVTFRAGAADSLSAVHWIFKAHLLLGFTIFLVFPFTRLVHVWSGFATVYYMIRPYQVVRSR
jgi:nitrate reductase gamma subunit